MYLARLQYPLYCLEDPVQALRWEVEQNMPCSAASDGQLLQRSLAKEQPMLRPQAKLPAAA